MNISLVGLGNVGLRVLEILAKAGGAIEERTGDALRIISASDSRFTVFSEKGLDPSTIMGAKSRGDIRKSGYDVIETANVSELSADVIVDVASATPDGKQGRDLYLNAFRNGKDVVTANKAPLSLHWSEIMRECQRWGRRIRFESTVAGGVPLFNLRDFSIIPSSVTEFRGVVSSSVNIILADLLEGKDFAESVRYAIEHGIAETDYHDDTLGLDAARKTVILANALFGESLTLNDIKYEGVENNDPKIASLEEAGGVHKVVSHISRSGKGVTVTSEIEEIKDSDPLRALGSMSLGYTMKTTMNGELLVVGLEDTPLETASGVVNDIALLAKLYGGN